MYSQCLRARDSPLFDRCQSDIEGNCFCLIIITCNTNKTDVKVHTSSAATSAHTCHTALAGHVFWDNTLQSYYLWFYSFFLFLFVITFHTPFCCCFPFLRGARTVTCACMRKQFVFVSFVFGWPICMFLNICRSTAFHCHSFEERVFIRILLNYE